MCFVVVFFFLSMYFGGFKKPIINGNSAAKTGLFISKPIKNIPSTAVVLSPGYYVLGVFIIFSWNSFAEHKFSLR